MGLYDLLLASNINGGSGKVIANPDEPATAELEKLKVGDSVYSVVTKAVNDLANYYTKSDVYTKTEVNNIAQARFQVVAELPSSDIQTNVIYLVPKSSAQTDNDYDEYIYALKSTNPDTYGWEKIGDTEIDLSGYVTTSDLNTALADYTTTADLTTLLAEKQNTLTFDNTPTASSNNPVTSGGIKTYVDTQGAKTASGNPITLTDAEGMSADDASATIILTQTGSGTPSPSNVRPFTGFSSVEVTVKDEPTNPTATNAYTVQLGDTYYQGQIDITGGKIVCNYASVLINDLNCVRNGYSNRFWIQSSDLSNVIVKATSNTDVVDMYCEIYKKEAYGNIWGGLTGIGVTETGDIWMSCPSNITTVQDFKAQFGTYRIVYPLAAQMEAMLTPQQIELLEDNNTITTNVSSLNITYQTNNAIGDTFKAIDKRVTRLEEKIPQPPTTDGTYKLTVTVASGTPTYSWESAT